MQAELGVLARQPGDIRAERAGPHHYGRFGKQAPAVRGAQRRV